MHGDGTAGLRRKAARSGLARVETVHKLFGGSGPGSENVAVVALLALLLAVLRQLTGPFGELAGALLRGPFPAVDPSKGGVVLVTGAGAAGIGGDAAATLCRLGFTVVGTVRKQADADALAKACPPGGAITVFGDATNPSDVARWVATAEDQAKKTNTKWVGLLTTHGFSSGTASVELSAEADVRKLMDVNFFSVLAVVQASLPYIRRDKARIVLIGSTQGVLTFPGGMPYAASKHAVHALFLALRAEMVPFGVSVSITVSSAVDTGLTASLKTKGESEREMEKATPPPSIQAKYDADVIFTTKMMASVIGQTKRFAPLPKDSTTPDIVHALTARFPHALYYDGAAYGVPSVVEVALAWLLPLTVNESLFAMNLAMMKA